MKVIVYTRNYCAACMGTKLQLGLFGIPFEERNVEEQETGEWAEQLVAEGFRMMPVVMVYRDGERVDEWAGNNLEKLKSLTVA